MAVGYLLQPSRIAVTAIVVIGACAVVYHAGASAETITYSGSVPQAKPAEAATAPASQPDTYGLEQWHDGPLWGFLSALYFSMTTFVTLGYGDFAPQGWFKLIAATEGLLGVTLLALFTVAWGRKLVR